MSRKLPLHPVVQYVSTELVVVFSSPFYVLELVVISPLSLLIRVLESVFLFFLTHPTKGLSVVDLSKKYLLVLLIFSIIFLFSVLLCSDCSVSFLP